MKIERQTGKHRRWSIEVDPSIERAIAVIAVTVLGSAAVYLGWLRAIIGG